MRKLPVARIVALWPAVGLVVSLGACTLGDRAEILYFRQHRAVTALAETIAVKEARDPAMADTLYKAEAELNEACAPLRQAGYLRFQNKEIDRKLEWEIVNALDVCATKTAEMETLLWQVSPETAVFYLPPLPTDQPPSARLTLTP